MNAIAYLIGGAVLAMIAVVVRDWWADRRGDTSEDAQAARRLDVDQAKVAARWKPAPRPARITALVWREPAEGGLAVTMAPRLVHTGPSVPASVVLPDRPSGIDVALAAMWAELDALSRATSLAVEAIPLAVTHV